MKRSAIGWSAVFLAALALAACASQPTVISPANSYRAVDFAGAGPRLAGRASTVSASLWPGDTARSLVADHRARGVNDLVTVQIVEDSSASDSASTTASRQSSTSMGISGLLGFEQSLARLRPGMDMSNMVGATTNNSFAGQGQTTRATKVLASISCTVVDVFPNGNLLIRGKRMILVNAEEQIITLSGIIRPEDIATDNTIQSIRIADARITYMGVGPLADKQSPGWLTHALDNVWPF
jgi:flagellar L-ring protein precursor FlgH